MTDPLDDLLAEAKREQYTRKPAKYTPEKLSCRHCGAEFLSTRRWQVFCSRSCRGQSHIAAELEAAQRRDSIIDQLEAENAALRQRVAQLEAQLK